MLTSWLDRNPNACWGDLITAVDNLSTEGMLNLYRANEMYDLSIGSFEIGCFSTSVNKASRIVYLLQVN